MSATTCTARHRDVDSGKSGSVEDVELVASGDAFVGQTVNEITSSPVWATGHNAIIIAFDEGNFATQRIPTIAVTNKGPRGVRDKTEYSHYSLLVSLQQAFGLGCLQNSGAAAPMTPLFEEAGASTTPTLPPPFTPRRMVEHGQPDRRSKGGSPRVAEECRRMAGRSKSKLCNPRTPIEHHS